MKSKTKPFLYSYYHDGSYWSLTMHAYDWPDAEARAKKLGIRLDGELMATIPTQFGWVARLTCWIQNFFTQPKG